MIMYKGLSPSFLGVGVREGIDARSEGVLMWVGQEGDPSVRDVVAKYM
jgi:hypothetical protein